MPTPLADFVRRFYEARTSGDPEALRPLIAEDVVWEEPEIADHMGRLIGADAVLDMIARALAATGGTFRLEVTETLETATHCAAVVAWSAARDGRPLRGRELAVFRIAHGRIAHAAFHPENIADDKAFWGEG